MSLVSAALVAGRYKLDRLIASDRSGEVWQGTDIELARPVAVKLLHTGDGDADADDADAVSKFRAAACRAASLTHEGLVRIFDYCEPGLPDAPRSPFLVMEFIDGQSLADQLRVGPLGAARIADIVAQVTAALQTVHEAGLGHGDVRPEKILLSGGAAKLFGFSGACPAGPAAISADLQALGEIARECLGESSSPASGALAGQLQAPVAELVAELCAHIPAGQADATAAIARRAAALAERPSQRVAAGHCSSPSPSRSSWPASFASPASTQPLRRLRRRARRLAPAGLPAKQGSRVAVRAAAVMAIALASAAIFGAVELKPNGITPQADGAAKAAMVKVAAARLVGWPVGIVRKKLERLGLVVRIKWQESASVSAGDTTAVRPSGLVPAHSVVVIVGSSGRSAVGAGQAPSRHRHPRRSASPSSAPPTPSRSPSGSPTPAPSPSPSSSPAPSPSPTSPSPSTSSSPPTSPLPSSTPRLASEHVGPTQ